MLHRYGEQIETYAAPPGRMAGRTVRAVVSDRRGPLFVATDLFAALGLNVSVSKAVKDYDPSEKVRLSFGHANWDLLCLTRAGLTRFYARRGVFTADLGAWLDQTVIPAATAAWQAHMAFAERPPHAPKVPEALGKRIEAADRRIAETERLIAATERRREELADRLKDIKRHREGLVGKRVPNLVMEEA